MIVATRPLLYGLWAPHLILSRERSCPLWTSGLFGVLHRDRDRRARPAVNGENDGFERKL